jgi:acetylornithine/succinyldiaminopimelate/putrescine aminotransferase
VLFNKAGNNTIRMAPPLIIGPPEIDRALAALEAAAAWAKSA